MTPIDWNDEMRQSFAAEVEGVVAARSDKLERVREESEKIQKELTPLKDKLDLVVIRVAGITESAPDQQLEEFNKISTELYKDRVKLADFRARLESQKGIYTEAVRDPNLAAMNGIRSKMLERIANLKKCIPGIRRASETQLSMILL